jgi:hypothetical protein
LQLAGLDAATGLTIIPRPQWGGNAVTRKPTLVFSLAAVAGILIPQAQACAGVRLGIGLNFALPLYYPAWNWGPYYYPYRPVYYVPPPVVVQPAPVYVQAAPAAPPVYPAPASETLPPPRAGAPARSGTARAEPEIDWNLQRLADSDERVRAASAVQLGRFRAYQATDSLTAMLASDRSASVREAAVRALAMIGSPRALPALRQAASADSDPEVRHTAQFAVDIMQVNR